MQLVVQSGISPDGAWVDEERIVLDDDVSLFGEQPSMTVSAIAIMVDSEGSKSESSSDFDDIQIGRYHATA